MADLGQMALQITADPTSFEAGLKKAADSARHFADTAVSAFSNISAAALAVAATPLGALTLAAGAVAGAIGSMMHVAEDAARQQGTLERRFGMSAEAAVGLAYQIRMSGMDIDTATSQLRSFQRRLAEAADRGGDLNDRLNSLGLNARQLAGTDVAQALAQIGDATNRQLPAGQALAAQQDILGRRAEGLSRIMREGTERMEASRAATRGNAEDMSRLATQLRQTELAKRQLSETFSRSVSQPVGGFFSNLWGQIQQGGADIANQVTGHFSYEGGLERRMRIGREAQSAVLGQNRSEHNSRIDQVFSQLGRQIEANSNITHDPAREQNERAREQAIAMNATTEEMRRLEEEMRRNTNAVLNANAARIQQGFGHQEFFQDIEARHGAGPMGANERRLWEQFQQGQITARQRMDLMAQAGRLDERQRDIDDTRRFRNVDDRMQSQTDHARFLADARRIGQLGIGRDEDVAAEFGRRARGFAGQGVQLASAMTAGSVAAQSIINQHGLQTRAGPEQIIEAIRQQQQQQTRDAQLGRELLERLRNGQLPPANLN